MDLLRNINTKSRKFYGGFGAFVVLSIIFGVDISFLFAFSMWSMLMFYSLMDLKNRILLAAFLVAFFTFLLGGHFVFEYFGMEIKHYLGYRYYLHSNITIAISLIFLYLGVLVSEKVVNSRRKKKSETKEYTISMDEKYNREILRFITKMLYFTTYLFYLYVVLDKVIFLMYNSYLDYFVDYKYNIPFVVNAVAAMTPYFFYLFLATLPSKKESIPLICLQLIYAVVSLLTGRRIDFMLIILFIAIYFLFRHYYNKEDEKWINKKYIIGVIVLTPILLMSLFLYNYIRHGISVKDISVKNILFGFFQQQGFSSSVIRLGLYYQDVLRDDAYFSFFGLVKFFRTNTILKLLFDPQYNFSYINNNVEFALKGNSLSNTLSYYTLHNYLSGWAVGSSYIAELYHDFGYFGISIGNVIYGVVITIINTLWMRVKKYNVWITAICFSLVGSFLKAPRWNFDIIFTYLLDLGMWSAFLGVFILYLILKNKKVEKYIVNKYIRKR